MCVNWKNEWLYCWGIFWVLLFLVILLAHSFTQPSPFPSLPQEPPNRPLTYATVLHTLPTLYHDKKLKSQKESLNSPAQILSCFPMAHWVNPTLSAFPCWVYYFHNIVLHTDSGICHLLSFYCTFEPVVLFATMLFPLFLTRQTLACLQSLYIEFHLCYPFPN